jgi:hypothetical protein
MKLLQATPSAIGQVWTHLASSISDRPCIAEVATAVVAELYEKFEESLVMARAFLTVPYEILPERQRQFATNLAQSVQLENLLGLHTPVHCLLASRGQSREWNDPHESRGHVAIPLLCETFVSSIPMMSRLLKELGLPLSWVQDPGAAMERQMLGSEVGVFFVADPTNATDELGRKIISAQDFVTSHSVRSVFAVGGVMFGGAVFVLVFFGKDSIESRTARAFMPIINHVKGFLISRCSMLRVFPADNLTGLDDADESVPPIVGARD